jgi:hypothetical protein
MVGALGSLRRPLARRSLKPQLNQIRTWVRQGRTDAWIAHQLEVSVGDIRSFKREYDLAPADAAGDGDGEPFGAGADGEEQDLRAEDDALVAAALDAELQAEEEEEEEEEADEDEGDEDGAPAGEGEEGEGEAEARPRRRRRGRRGGRGRRRRPKGLEGTFDHGEEGYGLWLDPAVQDDPVYAEHWAGHRPVTVTVEPDRIVISRAGEDADGDENED